ncbi:lactococcin 972 family bacteriocin [Raineyella sp. W15-4]|uniref:lactococcin 972 family bacteriocin n=1 Tax=Raineyella sp. W15-4 TaxID=3081651 RepID=UPI003989FCCC
MNRIAKAIATAVVTLGIAAGSAASANATVVPVGGGTWNYGVGGIVWSNYYHGSKVHGSTACSGVRCVASPWTPQGRWSYASTSATLAGNTAYWRVS